MYTQNEESSPTYYYCSKKYYTGNQSDVKDDTSTDPDTAKSGADRAVGSTIG